MARVDTSAIRAVLPSGVEGILTVEGLVRGRKLGPEAAARVSRAVNGGRVCGALPRGLAERLAVHWGVFTPPVDAFHSVGVTMWVPGGVRAIVEKQALRRGESLGGAAGRIILETLERDVPAPISTLAGELAAALPEHADPGTPLPEDAVDLVLDLRAAISDLEGEKSEVGRGAGGKTGGKRPAAGAEGRPAP